MAATMTGAMLPGNSTVEMKTYPVPEPAERQVVVRMRASGICGSDLRCSYFEHVGVGAEAYQNVIAGHEPAGDIVAVGPGVRRFGVGDRVIVYHIAGCGLCSECRRGYFISCTDAARAAYGWQRDGGHAEYILVEEATCVALPDELSYVDGAVVACGFGTAYEALLRANVSGRDQVLVTGLGPVGLAVGLLAKAMGAHKVIGVDLSESRVHAAIALAAVDEAFVSSDRVSQEILTATAGTGTEVSIDCSGSPAARRLALQSTRRWGRCVMVGEGNSIEFDVSHDLIHQQITLMGSWVTSIFHMERLVDNLVSWGLAPERIVTDRYPLDDAGSAYARAADRDGGKVVIVQ